MGTLTTLYTDYQMNTFIYWPSGDRERQSRIFAENVMPAARQPDHLTPTFTPAPGAD